MNSINKIAFRGTLLGIFVISIISSFDYLHPDIPGVEDTQIKFVAAQGAALSITSLSPNSCHAGDPGFLLTVNGTGFLDGSIVKWNASALSTQYTSSTQLKATIPASYLATTGQVAITVENPLPDTGTSNTVMFTILQREYLFLPISIRNWPPQAYVPVLEPIENADQDYIYTIKWGNPTSGGIYILEEAWDSGFTNAGVAYQGTSLSWTVPTGGKLPRTYYYRVKAKNSYMESGWSATQSVTIYPLYVGLRGRWDGKGFLYIDDYYEPGTHKTFICDALTDADTIRCKFNKWYDPNPLGWESETWNSYYSVKTGEYKSTDAIDDPVWKWGYSWKLAYNSWFTNGDTVRIGEQKFTVSGPTAGYTSYGQPINYWEFINQEKFLVQDTGDGLATYVHPGDVILRYDAGSSGLLLYDNFNRHVYYEGEDWGYYARYISNLSAATSLPGSPPVPMSSLDIPPVGRPLFLDRNGLEGELRSYLPGY